MAGKRVLEIVIAGDGKGGAKAFGTVQGAAGKAGKAMKTFAKVAGAAGLVAGAAVLKVGDSFNQARNSIAQDTGAAGAALDALYGDFKGTLGRVPDDMATVASVIGTANTLFGESGQALQDLSANVLDFSRIAGGDAARNAEAIGQLSKQFGLDAAGAAEGLDDLFAVTQGYNISGEKLLNMMQRFGPVFSNAGFSLEETGAIVGQLHAAGVDLTRIGPALNKFFRDSAAEGRAPQEALADIETAIKGASTATEALSIATSAFGAEGAQRMVSALRDGGVELTNLNGILGDNQGLLGETADSTASFSEKWNEFKNRVLARLEPGITRVFDAVMRGMDWISNRGIPAVERIINVFGEQGFAGVMALLGQRFAEAWPAIRSTLGDLAQAILDWVVETAPKVAEQLVEWGKAFVEWVGPQIPPFLDEVGKFIGAALEWLLDEGLPMAVENLLKFGKAFVEWVGPQIPPLLVELGKLLLRIGDWIVTDAAPKLLGKLVEWGKAFVEWVGPQIPPLLVELGKLLLRIGDWIVTDAAPAILGKLAEWTAQFITWAVTDLLPTVLLELGKFLIEIGRWLAEDAPGIILSKLARWSWAFIQWASEIPGKVLDALGGLGQAIWDAIRAAWDWVGRQVESLSSIDLPGVSMPDFGNFGFGDLIDPFDIFHAGGVFHPPGNSTEGLALLRRGEEVLTPGSARRGGGGGVPGGNVYLDGQLAGRWIRQVIQEEVRRNGDLFTRGT